MTWFNDLFIDEVKGALNRSDTPGGGGGVSSWNDLPDRPFGEEVTKTNVLEWDGDMTDMETVYVDPEHSYVRIYDGDINYQDLLGGILTPYYNNKGQVTEPEVTLDESWFFEVAPNLFANEGFVVVQEDNASFMGFTFNKGIYSVYAKYDDRIEHVKKIEALTPIFEISVITPLPTKYLPEHLQFGEEEVIQTNVIEFDGNLENVEYYDPFNGTEYAGSFVLAKLWDSPLSKEEMLGAIVTGFFNNSSTGYADQFMPTTVSEDNIYELQENVWSVTPAPMLIVTEDNTTLTHFNNVTVNKGIYSQWTIQDGILYLAKIEALTPVFTKSTITPLPTKYLPEHLQFGGEVTKTNVLEWNGDTRGLDNIQGALFKVSDVTFESAEVLNGGKMTAKVLGTVEGENDTHTACEITEALELGKNLLDLTAQGLPAIMVQSPDDIGDFYIAFDDADFGGDIILTRGVWLPYRAYPTGTYYISKLEATEPVFTKSTITPLNEKYLPETVATKSFVEELLGGIENGTY